MTKPRLGFTVSAAVVAIAYSVLWLWAHPARTLKIAVVFVGFATNRTATYTTKDGTFPITSAEFRITNLGTSRAVQAGVYSLDARSDPWAPGCGLLLSAPEMYGILGPRQSKTVSVMTPEGVYEPWRVRFQFSKYGWRHRVQMLLWGRDIVRRVAPEGWLTDIPFEMIPTGWINANGEVKSGYSGRFAPPSARL